ncbi:MAG TPA: hypothetical protein VHZ26_02730 [Caulobacteraceae bacterium]|jgi:hypothetical protein|nr:hypothetical protein [Caulobacteraceae bacterium]
MPDAPSSVVLGFRPHTYWTAVVALAGPPEAPVVVERRRVDFAAGAERMVFHRAETMDLALAEPMIEEVRVAVEANAARGIGAVIAGLKRGGAEVRCAVVPAGAAKLPEKLEDILKVHARMHAAEGNFYRGVVASACEALGLAVHRAVERELPPLVADRLETGQPALTARLKAMGLKLGPPWSEDYRLATLAAWLHLDDEEASA